MFSLSSLDLNREPFFGGVRGGKGGGKGGGRLERRGREGRGRGEEKREGGEEGKTYHFFSFQ